MPSPMLRALSFTQRSLQVNSGQNRNSLDRRYGNPKARKARKTRSEADE